MKKLLAISLLGVMALGAASQAFATANPMINLALDVQAKAKTRSVGSCAGVPTYTDCSQIVQVATVGEHDIMAVLYHFTGVTGAEFGVHWTYAYVTFEGFTKCSDLDVTVLGTNHFSTQLAWSACKVPSPPEPGTGGVVAAWFRAITLAPGTDYTVTPTDQGALDTTDCQFLFDDFHTVHSGHVGTPIGTDLPPCTLGPTATQPMTWSGVKALYK